MKIIKGISASNGVVIGEALVLGQEEYRIARPYVRPEEVDDEQATLSEALAAATRELEQLRKSFSDKFGDETARVFEFHGGLLLKSTSVMKRIEALIRDSYYSAAHAVHEVLLDYQSRFLALQDTLFASRARDVEDVRQRMLRHLLGDPGANNFKIEKKAIVFAHDLTPSQVAQLDQSPVIGLATDLGGSTSHTAIIAHSMKIPAVVGLQKAADRVKTGDTVIVDGTRGVVIIDPDEDTLASYRKEVANLEVLTNNLTDIRDLPAETKDGVAVELLGNIEFDHEATSVVANGGQGVGLYRTEFLYLSAHGRLTEEQHYDAYCKAAKALKGRPLTIRTIDVGADKYSPLDGSFTERNPFLGLRAIRFCLQNLPLFKIQLRAILRTALEYPVKLMFPMVTTLMELRQAKMVLGEAMEDLEEANVPFGRDLEVGIMIETPAAALQCKAFARESDFFSIGTNDLVQYALAVDRSNERVAPLYSASNPSVLRMMLEVIRTASQAKIGCSVCGEMASQPIYTLLLLGMGLRTFSVHWGDIPEIKKIIRSTTIRHAERVSKRAMSFDTDRQVTNYLREETRKIVPELV